jgi:hypothetical protein
MRRPIIHLSVLTFGAVMLPSPVAAQPSMKPTAPQKMMSPGERYKLEECQKQAAQRNIAMDQRAEFLMDCMTQKAR